MESEIYPLEKPAAGAARIDILYRSFLENVQHFRKGGVAFFGNPCDVHDRVLRPTPPRTWVGGETSISHSNANSDRIFQKIFRKQ